MGLGISAEVGEFDECPVFKSTTFVIFNQYGDDEGIVAINDQRNYSFVCFSVVNGLISKFP